MFADRLPSKEEMAAWLRAYPDGNIGMAMGPASGLVAVDIDTDDPVVIGILDRLLPPSPWHRVGAKGMVRIFKFSGERTTRIQTPEGMICEILSKGTQICLPPSIHPDTQRPYTANANLYDVLDSVPKLMVGIEELIREELMEAGYDVGKGGTLTKTMDFVPAGARDNKMVAMAGLLARAVLRGERSLNDALSEIALWVEEKVEHVIGDPISVEKAQKKLVEFVNRDVHGIRKMALPSGWDDGLEIAQTEALGLDISEDDEKWSITRLINQMAYDFQENPASYCQIWCLGGHQAAA
ncbi:bifunctional DNA primase/polymerase [Salipiger sp. 1_MG-2023]|uniref:bifunctional DNA primase/polymerase n=1 Tax=Salipiger sp. 1_MG-2023 TaxID=3062665 RepID=UPI0026E32C9E|nr:bifunctional DNA primase/polymerase [Salipiger sp. 1_MG-2023]MDO6588584.1 bifunctional DNA primase/polymerase [Salipiger sp. 1_MG-2023]